MKHVAQKDAKKLFGKETFGITQIIWPSIYTVSFNAMT
jgi:hypothetical protein